MTIGPAHAGAAPSSAAVPVATRDGGPAKQAILRVAGGVAAGGAAIFVGEEGST